MFYGKRHPIHSRVNAFMGKTNKSLEIELGRAEQSEGATGGAPLALDATYLSIAQAYANIDAAIRSAKSDLELRAISLVGEFRDERKRLQEAWATTAQGRASRESGYAPLNLFARVNNGSLEVYWQLCHLSKGVMSSGRKRTIYTYLARDSRSGYRLTTLMRHAKEFERDLVQATEREASLLREQWAQWATLTRCSKSGAKALRTARSAAATPDTKPESHKDHEMVPSVEL
jgi:hypothetical protein